MRVQLWCVAVDGSEGGTPARLLIEGSEDTRPVVLSDDTERKKTPKFIETIQLAYQVTASQIGWPKKGFKLSIACANNASPSLPNFLYGTSHFGAVVLGLFQAVALTAPGCVRESWPDLLGILQSVRLESVAITAAWDEAGVFKDVGLLRKKLEGFSMYALNPHPAVCFVAMDQKLEAPVEPLPDISEGLPLRGVATPMAAYKKLWDAQNKSLARRL